MNQKNNNFSICNLTRGLSIDTYRTNNRLTIDKFGSIHFYSRIHAFAFEGQAIQDSVFEIVNGTPEFISIILKEFVEMQSGSKFVKSSLKAKD